MQCVVRPTVLLVSLLSVFCGLGVSPLARDAQAQDSQVWRELRRTFKEGSKLDPSQIDLLLKAGLEPTLVKEAQTTIRVLARQLAPLLMETLRERLRSGTPALRRSAADTLELLGVHAAPAALELRQALRDPDAQLSCAAAKTLGALGTAAQPAIADLMWAAFESDNPHLRFRAALSLGNLGSTTAQEAMVRLRVLLKSPDFETQWRAFGILVRLGNSGLEALPELLELSHSTDPGLRYRALSGLSALLAVPVAPVVHALQTAFESDPNPEIRVMASEALVRHGFLLPHQAWPQKTRSTKKAGPTPSSPVIPDTRSVLPALGISTELCQALTWIREHREWSAVEGIRAELGFEGDAWEVAVHSLQFLLLTGLSPNLSQDRQNSQWTDYSLSLESVLDRSSKSFLALSDDSWSAADLYAKIFRSTLLQKLNQDSTAIHSSLVEDLGRMRTSGLGHSALSTYSWSAAMVALHRVAPENSFKIFESWIDSHIDPLALRYVPESMTFPENRKSSAARNVPAHLALYLRKRELSRAQTLVDAIVNWMNNAVELIREIPRNGTHNDLNDGIAPYYFYSSLPYLTSAIKLLERNPKLPEGSAATLASVKTRLRAWLPKLMSGGTLRLIPGVPESSNNLYHSAPSYTYPLYGLALLALVEKDDACYRPELESDFGIVP
ncbi:MAG: HEAT repeat domain-containing protein [Oligoflexia bacterium]